MMPQVGPMIRQYNIFYSIHTIFNLYQQYRHSMAVPSVTNAQGQVSVQWSPEAGAKGTFDQADHSTYIVLAIFIQKTNKKQTKNKKNTYFTVSFICI